MLTFLPYLAAYAISYLLGIVLSYLLLTRFVFRAPPRLSTAVRFPLVYVAQYLLGSAVLALLVEAFDIPVVGWGLRRFRQIPIRRGAGDRAALEDAAGVIARGALAG